MNLASNEARDTVAQALGSFFDWLIPDTVTGVLVWVGGLVLVWLLWALSISVFPAKRCSRCKGNGSWGPGLLRRGCGKCSGTGRVPRVGSGRR